MKWQAILVVNQVFFLIQQINNTSEVGALTGCWIPEPISVKSCYGWVVT